ncbi:MULTISPECIES: potassium channel family protein [Aphanothece]|uniref:potassium channel family protein n=1 Tax=Aphanothece TaxID=1121 RepID=UPI00398E4F4D
MGGLAGIGITMGAGSLRASENSELQEVEVTSALLLSQFGLAVVMIFICTVIHILLTTVIIAGNHNEKLRRWMARSTLRQVVVIALAALITFVAMAVEIVAWALLYLQLGALSDVEKALYFSAVSFTSLGYGDVTLQSHYRLLGSFEALVGILMAGWSAALLVAVSQKIIAMRRDSHQTDPSRPF